MPSPNTFPPVTPTPSAPWPRREVLRHTLATAAGVAALNLAGCGKTPPDRSGAPDGDLGPVEPELNLYLWSDYVADRTIPDFETEFRIKVTLDTFESNEEMIAKLLAGASGYDLILPTSNMFAALFANDLIAPLSRRYLTNWGNVSPLFVNPPWDRDNAHSVPWAWGTTGIAYRKDKVKEPPDSWTVFFDPAYRGKMTMLDDIRDVIGTFLKYRGKSLNSTVPADLAAAKADALAAKANLQAYVSAPVKAQLIAGDVWLAQLWSGDAAQAMAEQPEIGFVIPKEGSMIFTDGLAMPKTARHPRAAHEFMNYVLRPEVAAAIADKTGYGTPNQAAVPLTRAKVPYPTAEELARLEYQVDLGPAAEAWDRLWTEIKSA